jgi:hypothetical protein
VEERVLRSLALRLLNHTCTRASDSFVLGTSSVNESLGKTSPFIQIVFILFFDFVRKVKNETFHQASFFNSFEEPLEPPPTTPNMSI